MKMIRNLKVLGLALAAVFAMSLAVASAASATGTITGSPSTVKATATDTLGEKSTLKFNANQEITCHGHYYIGNVDETEEPEEHGWLDLPATEITVTPEYENCTPFVNGSKVGFATVTMNGCDFDIAIGATTEDETGHHWATTSQLTCPENKVAEIHVYSNEAHTTTICTYKFKAQKEKVAAIVRNVGDGTITLGGTVEGITAEREGILCGGKAETSTATLDIHAIASATDAGENPVEVEIS
jgi:hypothetical protein